MTHFITLVICLDVMNSEQVKKVAAKLMAPYDENNTVPEYMREDGELTTYNPNGKWDWYQVGGRYDDSWGVGNIFRLSDFPLDSGMPMCIVTPNGEWHELGRIGWWGNVSEVRSDWDKTARGILETYSAPELGAIGILLDTHI